MYKTLLGMVNGGLVPTESSSTRVHSNIDNLILQSELDKFAQTGYKFDPFMNQGGTVGKAQEVSKYSTFAPRPNDNSLIRALLGLIEARPELIEGKLKFPYQRLTLPIGGKTSFTAERGLGLYGQEFIPDINKKDLRFTLSRNF